MGRHLRARRRHRPSLGSVLIDAGGWRWAFFVNLPIAVVAGLAARRLVPETIIGGPVPDLVGVALLSGAVASLALGSPRAATGAGRARASWCASCSRAVLAPLAIRRSARHTAPAIDLELFRTRTSCSPTRPPSCTPSGSSGCCSATSSSSRRVALLERSRPVSRSRPDLWSSPCSADRAAVSLHASATARTRGRGITFAAGLLIYVWGVGLQPNYLTHWLPGALLVGVGVALSFPVLSAAAVAGLPQERFGVRRDEPDGPSDRRGARVAILIAIVGTPTSLPTRCRAFTRRGWSARSRCSVPQRSRRCTVARPRSRPRTSR